MNEGAFALIDCLGFKGLWKDGHSALMAKIRSINETIHVAVPIILKTLPIHFNLDQFSYEVKLLSDTVAISAVRSGGNPDFTELLVIASVVIAVSKLYLIGHPHLLLRGAIGWGKFTTDKNFIVGPAVDATAEYMESSEGAFIWYLPPASELIKESLKDVIASDLVRKTMDAFLPVHNIPIKGGHFLTTRAVNPLFGLSAEEGDAVVEIYKSVMTVPNMSVWMKRQNTLSFLDNCKAANEELKMESIVG